MTQDTKQPAKPPHGAQHPGLSRRAVLGSTATMAAVPLAGLGAATPAAAQAQAPAAPAPAAGKTPAPPGTVMESGEFLTTNQGVRISDDQNSLKVGARGPPRRVGLGRSTTSTTSASPSASCTPAAPPRTATSS